MIFCHIEACVNKFYEPKFVTELSELEYIIEDFHRDMSFIVGY